MFSVSRKEKIFFTAHLHLMLKSGVPLSEALEVLRDEALSKNFRNILNNILERVSEGESLSKSLERYPKVFNKFFTSVVKTGEESGTLEENLKYLNSSLESENSLRKKMLSALIYPLFIIFVTLFIVLALTIFVLPKLFNLFHTLNIQLPLATRIFLGIGDFFQKHWLQFFIGLIFSFLIYKILNRIKIIRFYFNKISLSFPIFGKINKNRNLAIFARTLYTLLKSGMPILESLDVCIGVLPSEVYKKELVVIRSIAERGEKVSQGLKKSSDNFPQIFYQMVAVGERTGALEESLRHLAQFYETEVDNSLKNLSTVLEPVLLIFVGSIVAFVALSIITPIYQFTSGLKFR
jgi:type II secretory pathway component PulF